MRARRRNARRAIPVLMAVALLIATACTDAESLRDASGEISETGSIAVTELARGDCFDGAIGDSAFERVTAQPCATPHDNEVYATFTHPSSEFPGEVALVSYAIEQCLDAFETFVGTPLIDSELVANYMNPTEESWDAGDHVVRCFLADASFEKLSGTAELTGR